MTDDPGLEKLAHDVTPMMLSVFARDPSSPAQPTYCTGQGPEGARGTSPIFGQLSDKPALACIWVIGVPDVKRNSGSKN
jgi:hypothetical protein